jgi:hypothetical protein
MKTLFLIFTLGLSLQGVCQYDTKDYDFLYRLNDQLSEPWQVDVDTMYLQDLGINLHTISIDLSAAIDGHSYGVEIYLWPKAESERIKSIFLNDSCQMLRSTSIYTKNYLVYSRCIGSADKQFVKAIEEILPEIETFFSKYKKRL